MTEGRRYNQYRRNSAVVVALILALSLPWRAFARQQAPDANTGAPAIRVEVIGTTPLPGVELASKEVPAPVQSATQDDIEKTGALDLSDFLNRRLNSVHANEIQGNPYQPDINYRGYTASPLLGTPQGLSVYMDGVRLNQPFGDVVSWDLIPRIAIGSTSLIPGSNPLFGLNALGGALSIQTKDGRRNRGTEFQAMYGSHVRMSAEFEHGGSNARGLDWYMAGNLFGEHGWRDSSHSSVGQLFGKFGMQRGNTDARITLAYANNSLTGNGLQEQRFLERDFSSIYTKPDTTDNRYALVNMAAQHKVGNSLSFSGNVYYRDIRTRTLNGDINEDSLDQAVYQPGAAERAALAAAGYTGFPTSGENAANTPFPSWRCIGNVLLNDEPGEKCNGLINRSRSVQHNYGLSGQFTLQGTSGGKENQFTAGTAYDHSTVGFLQSTQLGYLTPDRGITGLNSFADGVTGGDVDGEPFDARVNLNGVVRTWSAYATDTLTIGNAWNFTLSGRYNRTNVENTDLIQPGGGPGSLDGRHRFQRFNSGAGLTYSPADNVNVYFGYSEGSRAPTSIELGCADPNQPCKLPNALAGDPPLEQVVTKTFEAGVRGGDDARVNWSFGWFRAENRDDILFVASDQTGFGYFTNFDRTRRQGVELGATTRIGRITVNSGYTFLDATYQSEETVNGSSNSTNEDAEEGIPGVDGTIEIGPGNRIPLTPRHLMKAFVDIEATNKIGVEVGVVGVSSSYARGNENNLHVPDGVYYLGPGQSPGYGIVHLGARYRLHPNVQLIAQVNNLFDRRYYTAAQLGANGFTSTGNFIARPFAAIGAEFPVQQSTFFAPGSPRTFWVATRFRF